GEDAGLFDAVNAVGMELCPALGISIPVGKDSLSMRSLWETSDGQKQKMIAPLSLVVSSFSPVLDVRKTVTPDLKPGHSRLLFIDLGEGRNRLGCSALSQVYNQIGDNCPDLDNPTLVVAFFEAVQEMIENNILMAYHDRSDGGLFVALFEMAVAGRIGLDIDLSGLGEDPMSVLFSEELGAVLQVAETDVEKALLILAKHNMASVTHEIGSPCMDRESDPHASPYLRITFGEQDIFVEKLAVLNRQWSELTYRMQALRDNPDCAKEEFTGYSDESDPGMTFSLTFDPNETPVILARRPKIAIFREQGINGQIEMAAAFDRAGFTCVDVHMTDLLSHVIKLDDFAGMVACGGFSYGDVLGAGSGWAKSILYNNALKEMFAEFFARNDTFALGVCNGCQMMSQLKDIIPGAEHWPVFKRNRSEQFEARYVTVEILNSPSILFEGMTGSRIGIPVAHGEGRADFEETGSFTGLQSEMLIAVRYVNNRGEPAVEYPANPNGSPLGITGLTNADGRVTVMMPHPERAFRAVQMSYRPKGVFVGENGPWLRMFQNARRFVG
ncbi:MAG: phosphoribosylformylglycinamidine synthase, partial [Lentisphaerae bacterium]|nr:phosphoribosylformylglycinamidine synthase [Lentisphaerota bacterium]